MTRFATLACAAVLSTLAFGATARAQEVNLGAVEEGQHHVVHATFGAERAFVAGAGYGYIFHVADRPLILSGLFTMPWATPDFGDYRLRAGAQMTLVGDADWKLVGRAGLSALGSSTEMARLTSLIADFGVRGGYYARRWLAAVELNLEWTMTTHVHHTAEYRQLVYEDARSGWYASPGASFQYGVVLGHSVGRYDILLRVGQGRDIRGGGELLPFYATLGFNARF